MINKAGQDLIEFFESCKLTAYECATSLSLPKSKKFWTIGWGNTTYADGKKVKSTDTITQEQADKLFGDILNKFESDVVKLLKIKATENQLAALVSFSYNVGVGNFASSTLLKKFNAKDFIGASQEFAKWNKSNGKVLNGLVTRRKREAELFMK
jgi:lysozyme